MDFTSYELKQIYALLKAKIDDDHKRIAADDTPQELCKALRANIKLCTRAIEKIVPVLSAMDEDFSPDLCDLFLFTDPADYRP